MEMFVDNDAQICDHYQMQDHQRMDAEVMKGFPEDWWEQDPSEVQLLYTLQIIIDGDRKLDKRFSKFCEELPNIVWTTLREVWKTSEFRRVRILRCIQRQETITSYPLPAYLAEEMTCAYEGNSVKAFIQYLKFNEDAFRIAKPRYYGRFCSITQSSGTGKTRLLLELGKTICVLYINIRHPEDVKGYPPRDHIPADILTADLDDENEYAFQCQAFFATVFKCIGDFLQEGNSFEALSDLRSDTRTIFFESVLEAFGEITQEMRTTSDDVVRYYLETMVGEAAKANKHSPQVVIALDESHVLDEKSNRSYVPASVLLRAISAFRVDQPLWVVFASTVPKVVDFAPPQTVFPSARAASEGQKLFPPFTLLGWDQHGPALKNVVLDKVALASHLLRYGRPLWWSLRSGGIDEIKRLAREKLCASVTFDSSDKYQAFAVLGQRFGLDMAFGRREAMEYNEKLIASHLRIWIKTTEDRKWSYTTYPAEPFLSVAAAESLHADENNLRKALGVVNSFFNNGLINAGDSGELASRFIWLLAKDRCVKKGTVTPSCSNPSDIEGDRELPYCQLVPVVAFLEGVFGSGVTEKAPGIKTTFSDAYVNFNHWIRMNSNIVRGEGDRNDVSIEEWTESLWARTSAVQCCHNQPGIDKVIPIFFKSQPRGKSMSHILISDKAREQSERKTLMDIARHKITLADCPALPYIVILADLGVDVDGRSEDECLKVFEEKGNKPGDHCFRIHALGLDSKTFKFLEPSITKALRDLYAWQDAQDAPPGSTSVQEELENQVQFGRSRERCYLNWKA